VCINKLLLQQVVWDWRGACVANRMSNPIRKPAAMLQQLETAIERRTNPAVSPVISDRIAYLCAAELLRLEGEDAVLTAAERADEALSRMDDQQHGYWRRVETAMQIILLEDVVGEIH
jgi:hypothetical protein